MRVCRTVSVIVVGVAGALLSACGTSGGGGSSPGGVVTPTISPSLPSVCPSTPVKVPFDPATPAPGSLLVPTDVVNANLCVYPTRSENFPPSTQPIVVKDAVELMRALNTSVSASGKTYSCPPDEGGADIVTFGRPTGTLVVVAIPRSGCAFILSTNTSGPWTMTWETHQYLATIDPSFGV